MLVAHTSKQSYECASICLQREAHCLTLLAKSVRTFAYQRKFIESSLYLNSS